MSPRLLATRQLILPYHLDKINNATNLEMQYVRYDIDIQSRYKVELRGWPHSVQFTTPYSILTMFEIRLLRNSLLSGECHWASMAREYVEGLTQMLANAPAKPRAQRSDKGKTRGPWQRKAPQEPQDGLKKKGRGKENGTTKRRKKAVPAASQVPPMPKSKEFIDDSGEESEEL